ncbi:ABC transporter substrate-binding protein [Leifsonia aquatica]|uniref:ABC transporter substrate-binding protein n=1 Tax=Leifsonia aquatica TaxID=144185 RepID=UPI0028A8C355|nr:ABC transporter substrate-binding protein [Leifsonia aquatica]
MPSKDPSTRRKWLTPRKALVAGVVIALALSGCTSARSVGQSTGDGKPVDGGTLTVAMALDALPSGLFGTLDRNWPWVDNVFEPLIRLEPGTRKIEPVLATSVDVASDGKSAKVSLRKGVTFQNGQPFTADAVKFTIEKSIDPASGDNLAFVAKQFTNVAIDNSTSLTISFSKVLGDSFLDYLNQTEIVDPSSFAGLADGSKVVGTGPFSFGDWRPGAGFTLSKYKDYWDAKQVHLDTIEYVVTTDPTAEINAVKSGRAQVAYGMAPVNAATFQNNKQYNFVKGGGSIYPIGLNVQNAPLNTKEVRQAIAYAIDRKRLNSQVFAGLGTVTDLPWAPGAAGVGKSREQHYTYDPDKAKKLVKDAGAEGAEVTITYNRSNATVNAEYQIIANNLTAIGLKPVADGRDQPNYQAAQSQGTIPGAFLTLHGQVGLSASTIAQALPTLRKGNTSHMDTPEYLQLTAALANATNAKQSEKALGELSDYLLDQAFLNTMIQSPGAVVASSSVKNIDVSIRGLLLFKSAYVSK